MQYSVLYATYIAYFNLRFNELRVCNSVPQPKYSHIIPL